MKTRQLLSVLVCLALGGVGLLADAATISLQPSAAAVGPGSLFTVDLLLDAVDAPGTHPGGIYGGRVVVDFDPALLAYGGFSLTSDANFFIDPVVGSSGGRQTVTFGFYKAEDTGSVGSFSFTALGSPGTSASINIADEFDFFGSFVSYVPSNQRFYPEFVDTSVAVVPLPGTAWLLVTAFGAAAARARRAGQFARANRAAR